MEHHHLENQHMDVPDFDPNFEPQCRARSYTWPSRPREAVKEDDNRSTPTSTEGDTPVDQGAVNNLNKENLGLKAKTSSRRNAWGNLSYADLITKAIDSSPEKRLTLSQIYDWMVQNVSYFKDKGDTNSSAGWKNSIRHNLSLHSRFMRIQNEGTGKSSWWVLNPDAKPGKTPRRRATSMDTKAFEKKRGRVKKKLEQLRALGSGADQSPTTGSDYGDGELGCLDPFSLSPQDFRARTSSNASSIGGRLSPIQSLYEPDLHDSQVPPMSPIPWSQTSNYNNVEGPGFTETLSESLAEMFVGESMTSSSGDPLAKGRSSLSTPSPLQRQPSPSSYLPAPPPYSDQLRPSPRQMSPNSSLMMDNSPLDSGHGQGLDSYNPSSSTLSPMNIGTSMGNTDLCLQDSYVSQTLSELLQDSPPSSMQHSPQAGQSQHYNISMDKSKYHSLNGDNMLSGSSQNTQQQPQGSMSSLLRSTLTEKQQLARSQLQAMLQNQQQRQILQARLKQLRQQQMLRQQQQQLQQEQLKQQQMMRLQQQQQQQQQQLSHPPSQMSPGQQQPHGMIAGGQGTLQPHLMAGGMVQQVSSTTSPPFTMDSSMDTPMEMPTDLELVTISEGTSEDLQCDVDQIINHELSMDGLLDFNFDTGGSGGPIQT